MSTIQQAAENKAQSNKENHMPELLDRHRAVLESRVPEGKYVNPLITRSNAKLPPSSGAVESVQPKKKNTIADPKRLLNRIQQTYISPSDTILSPATQKLAAFKNKHLGKGYVFAQACGVVC